MNLRTLARLPQFIVDRPARWVRSASLTVCKRAYSKRRVGGGLGEYKRQVASRDNPYTGGVKKFIITSSPPLWKAGTGHPGFLDFKGICLTQIAIWVSKPGVF